MLKVCSSQPYLDQPKAPISSLFEESTSPAGHKASFSPDNEPEVLAIIPARGGSKGIPRKNLADICGKPLIAYSIEAALRSESIHRVVVSTEDEEIAAVSKEWGAEIPFLRPEEMAGDGSNIADAIDFTLKRLRSKGYIPDKVVTLYPTHLFRTVALIDFLVGKLVMGYSPVITVKMVTCSEYRFFSLKEGKRLTPLLDNGSSNNTRSEKVFFRKHGLFLGTSTIAAGRPYLHVIKKPISLIDIDTPTDLRFAEEVILEGLFDFSHGERMQ